MVRDRAQHMTIHHWVLSLPAAPRLGNSRPHRGHQRTKPAPIVALLWDPYAGDDSNSFAAQQLTSPSARGGQTILAPRGTTSPRIIGGNGQTRVALPSQSSTIPPPIPNPATKKESTDCRYDAGRSKNPQMAASSVTQLAELALGEPVMVAVLVEDGEANLLAGLGQIDLAAGARGQAEDPLAKDMDNVRWHTGMLNAAVNQRDACVKTAEVAAVPHAHPSHHLRRRIVLDHHRHIIHQVAHLLRQLGEYQLELGVEDFAELNVHWRAAAISSAAPWWTSATATRRPNATASSGGAESSSSSRRVPSGLRTTADRWSRPFSTRPRAPTGARHPPRSSARRARPATTA